MSNWDINILVNGNRCKQYQHEGKTFIEAKNGSEYVIEIKNNYWKRILAVSAVDGLNVLTGKTASEEDTGYIIDSYHSEKIKGFRFSDDEWAMFRFGFKFNGQTYAQQQGDGADKNCGVIGVRLFYEKEPLVIYNTPVTIPSPYPYPSTPINPPWNPYPTWTCQSSDCLGLDDLHYTSNVNYVAADMASDEPKMRSSANYCRSLLNESPKLMNSGTGQATITAQSLSSNPKGFDMGTEWGRKEQSKVHTVNFDRGCLAHSLDIYYASRESLIEMGVPITNQLKINVPQSFPEKYAKPPKNWVG